MDTLSFTIDKMPRNEAEQFMEDHGCRIQPCPYLCLMAKDDLATFEYFFSMPVDIVNHIRHNLLVVSEAIYDGYTVDFDKIQLRRFRELLQEVVDRLDTIDSI
jgi:hypothetical protein